MKLQRVNGSWVKSVGFVIKDGKRVQKRWYLGNDEATAIVLAAKLQTAWKKGEHVADGSGSPIWNHYFSLQHVDEPISETMSRSGFDAPVEGEVRGTTSVATALQWFYAQKERRLTLRNVRSIKQSSVNGVKFNLSACLAPFNHVLLKDFTSENCQIIQDYWLGIDHKDRENGRKETVSERTAINYLNTLKSFLKSCSSNPNFDYQIPKEVSAWRFTMKQGEVFTPTIEELGIIYRHASERMKCFILIALNAGQLSNDIGRMTHDDITIDNGHSVIRKVRLKTAEKVVYKGSWTLWAETTDAIKQIKTRKGLLFTNKDGNPLYEIKRNSKVDAIGDEFHKLIKRLVADGEGIREGITFSTIRAFGATWISDKTESEYFAKLYLAHSVASGATKHYIDAQYATLQPLLADLRKALTWL